MPGNDYDSEYISDSTPYITNQERIAIEKTRSKARKRSIMFFLSLSCAVLVSLLVMASPYFHIANIYISGVTMYTEGFLHSRMGLGLSQGFGTSNSIFYRSARSMEKVLEELPYIRAAKAIKEYPGTLIVTIHERIPRALVFDDRLNVYLCVDEEGYVLDISNYIAYDLPIMTGLRLSGYTVGQTLTSDDPVAASAISRLSTIFRRHNITDVARADVSDPLNIRLQINNITVHIGTMDDADQKINWAIACIEHLGPSFRGDLYAHSVETSYFSFP